MGLLGAALSWWCMIHLNETRLLAKQCAKDEQDRLERAEKVRKLTNKE